MASQEQKIESLEDDIRKIESIVKQLESEIRNIESNVSCRTLCRATSNFLWIIKSRVE